jgi:hypothetical protein
MTTFQQIASIGCNVTAFLVFMYLTLLLRRLWAKFFQQARSLRDLEKRCEVSEAEIIRLLKGRANWVALLIAVRRCEEKLGLERTELHVPMRRVGGTNDVSRDRKPTVAMCERCGWIITWGDSDTLPQSESQASRFWCPQCQALTMKDVKEGEGSVCS